MERWVQALHCELAVAQAALAAAGATASALPSQAAAAPPHAQPPVPPPVPAAPPPHEVPAAAAGGMSPAQAPACVEACRAAAALGELQRRLARTHGRLLSRDASARKYKASMHTLYQGQTPTPQSGKGSATRAGHWVNCSTFWG